MCRSLLIHSYFTVSGDIDLIDSHQSAYDPYPIAIKNMFPVDDEDDERADKKARTSSTAVIFGGKRPVETPPPRTHRIATVSMPVVEDGTNDPKEKICSENRLKMHHIMHYLEPSDTKKPHDSNIHFVSRD